MEHSRLTATSPQALGSPVIVGERYELAETAAANYAGELHRGLLAKREYDAALLPMSDYGKSSHSDLNGKLCFLFLYRPGELRLRANHHLHTNTVQGY